MLGENVQVDFIVFQDGGRIQIQVGQSDKDLTQLSSWVSLTDWVDIADLETIERVNCQFERGLDSMHDQLDLLVRPDQMDEREALIKDMDERFTIMVALKSAMENNGDWRGDYYNALPKSQYFKYCEN